MTSTTTTGGPGNSFSLGSSRSDGSSQERSHPRCRYIRPPRTFSPRRSLSRSASVYGPTDLAEHLLLNVPSMIAESEADLIRMRTREGPAVAKGQLRGKTLKLSASQRRHLLELNPARNFEGADRFEDAVYLTGVTLKDIEALVPTFRKAPSPDSIAIPTACAQVPVLARGYRTSNAGHSRTYRSRIPRPRSSTHSSAPATASIGWVRAHQSPGVSDLPGRSRRRFVGRNRRRIDFPAPKRSARKNPIGTVTSCFTPMCEGPVGCMRTIIMFPRVLQRLSASSCARSLYHPVSA
jgi:hypothetical protein